MTVLLRPIHHGSADIGDVSGGFGKVLVGGAVGFGLVIGWAGGFAGSRPSALVYRAAMAGLVLLAIGTSDGGAMIAAAVALAVAALSHDAFAARIRERRCA